MIRYLLVLLLSVSFLMSACAQTDFLIMKPEKASTGFDQQFSYKLVLEK